MILLQTVSGCGSDRVVTPSVPTSPPGVVTMSPSGPGGRSSVTSNGLWISGATDRAALETFAAQTAAARTWVQRTWPQQVAAAGTIRVVIATSDAQFARLRGGTPVTDDLAASTTADGTVIVSQQALSVITDQGRRVVLAHELTHVVLRQTQRIGVPRWIVEGSAEYTAYRWAGLTLFAACPTLRAQLSAGEDPSLPPGEDLFDGSTAQSAYQQAHAYMSFLITRFGLAAWKRFVVAADSGSQTAFGTSFSGSTPVELQRDYQTYLRVVMRTPSAAPR